MLPSGQSAPENDFLSVPRNAGDTSLYTHPNTLHRQSQRKKRPQSTLTFYSLQEAIDILDHGKDFLKTLDCSIEDLTQAALNWNWNSQLTPIEKIWSRIAAYRLYRYHIPTPRNAVDTRLDPWTRKGSQWNSTLESLASRTKTSAIDSLGFFCLPRNGSVWERTSITERNPTIQRFAQLDVNIQNTINLTSILKEFISQEPLRVLEEPPRPKSYSQRRVAMHTKSSPLLETLHRALPFPQMSDDASAMLVVLSFFAADIGVPVDLLVQGAQLRKRWTADGQVKLSKPTEHGLHLDLVNLLSDNARLTGALGELTNCHVASVSESAEPIYTISTGAGTGFHVSAFLSPELRSFWEKQVFYLVCRVLPWKSLETTSLTNIRTLQLHLKHILKMLQGDLASLPTDIKANVASTLIEACRLPGMDWKVLVLAKAKEAAVGLQCPSVKLCIAQAESLILRIQGRQENADEVIDEAILSSSSLDERLRPIIGLALIQSSLNRLQHDDLAGAMNPLKNWKPGIQPSSEREAAVSFQINTMLGRVLRYGGQFEESRQQLGIARQIYDCWKLRVRFEEDFRDFTGELANTFRELEDSQSSVDCIRKELARRQHEGISYPEDTPLRLSLAEAYFGQGEYEKAYAECNILIKRRDLFRYGKLRLHITLAKCYHSQSKFEEAYDSWKAALDAIQKLQLNGGDATRHIITSTNDVLGHFGTEQASFLIKEGEDIIKSFQASRGIRYWIPGLDKWACTLMRDRAL